MFNIPSLSFLTDCTMSLSSADFETACRHVHLNTQASGIVEKLASC